MSQPEPTPLNDEQMGRIAVAYLKTILDDDIRNLMSNWFPVIYSGDFDSDCDDMANSIREFFIKTHLQKLENENFLSGHLTDIQTETGASRDVLEQFLNQIVKELFDSDETEDVGKEPDAE